MSKFNFWGKSDKVIFQEDCREHHEAISKNRGDISPDSEYKNCLGEEFKKLHQKKHPRAVGSRHMRAADLMATKRMYVAGYSKGATIGAVMRNSPLTKNMTNWQKSCYKDKLRNAMRGRGINQERDKCAAIKNNYGIKSNRIQDLKDYGHVINSHQKGKENGINVKAPDFKGFQQRNDKKEPYKYGNQVDRAIIKKRESNQRSPRDIAANKSNKRDSSKKKAAIGNQPKIQQQPKPQAVKPHTPKKGRSR